MKKISFLLATVVVISSSAFTLLENVKWNVKQDAYTVSFAGGKVKGEFKGLESKILFDEKAPEGSRMMVSIDSKSLNTGNGMMNKHAMSEEALFSDNYPRISFNSTAFAKKEKGYEVTGQLSIRNITKEVVIPFDFTAKENEGLFVGKFTITPKDFGVTRSGTPDQVTIDLNIPVTR